MWCYYTVALKIIALKTSSYINYGKQLSNANNQQERVGK